VLLVFQGSQYKDQIYWFVKGKKGRGGLSGQEQSKDLKKVKSISFWIILGRSGHIC